MRTFTLSTLFFTLIFAFAGAAHTLPSVPEPSAKPIIDTLSEKNKVYRIRDGYYYTLLYGDNKVDSCSEVEKVTGSDRYVYYTGYSHGDCMLDAKTGKPYPVKTNLYDVSYLFDYKGKPLFTTGHIIFDLTGLEVAVEGQALHVDPANSSKERGICITNSYFSQGFINPKKLKNGTILSLEQKYDVTLDEIIDVNELGGVDGYYYKPSEIVIRIPDLYENPVLRQNVLFWLSEIMMEELHAYDFDVPSFVYTNPFVPSTETTTTDFVNYYAALILQGYLDVTFYDDEEEYFSQFWGGGYGAIAERLMKSDNLVTFFAPVDSNFGGGSGFGACAIPIATFNISDGRRIMLKDIIKEEHQEEFANFLRDEFETQEPSIFSYERPDVRGMLSFPVGMLADSLIFPISRHTILGAGGEISVPYSKIENWLKLRPTFDNIPPLAECKVIVKKIAI